MKIVRDRSILNKTASLIILFCSLIIISNCKAATRDNSQKGDVAITENHGCVEKTMEKQEAEITRPIFNYIEGWYDRDPERMKQGIHPYLAKRHPNANLPSGIKSIDYSSLLIAVTNYGGTKGDERRINIEILDTFNNIAIAKLTSNEFVDYLHIGLVDDRWVIINVLWHYIPVETNSTDEKLFRKEKIAIEKPIKDYVEGWYDKDADRMKQGLHANLVKRSINPDSPNGIDQYTRASLLEVVPLYGGAVGKDRLIDIEILDVQQDIACAKVTSNTFVDYLHLCKVDEQWLILNVLWSFK